MLNVSMEFRKGILFVRLYGVLNDSTLDIFEKEVKEVIVRAGILYVVLNVINLDEVSKNGIILIKRLKRIIEKNEGMFFLYGSEIKDLKKIVNLDNELRVFERVVI